MSTATTFTLDWLSKSIRSTENDSGGIDHRIAQEISLSSGVGVGQADLVFADRRTLAGTTSEILDLVGVLSDVFGNSITFVKLKGIAIRNRNIVDGDNLHVGPDATLGWGAGHYVADASDRRVVPAGRISQKDLGIDIWYDPNGVLVGAAATNELFVDNPGANPITYDIIIIGTSS